MRLHRKYRRIKISCHSLYAIVDTEDYPELVRYRWYLQEFKTRKNAALRCYRYEPGDKKNPTRYMHRDIMKPKCSTIFVDHINGNPLDNRRCNLRLCSNKENIRNGKLRSSNSTGYKGVQRNGPFLRARITVDGVTHHLGYFKNPIDAAKAYDKAAKQYFGEFASLNFP